MKKIYVLGAALMSLQCLFAQEQGAAIAPVAGAAEKNVATVTEQVAETTEKPRNGGKVKFKPYGFVRNYFYYDSRQNVQSTSGLYNQIPKDESMNEAGDEDLNDVSQSNFLAMTTRLGLDISGIRALNADLSAKIETDFCGFTSSTTMLRIRQAYLKMRWERHSLLAGQAWHPMSGDLPDVLGLASGSPFEPFSRSPQIRYDNYVGGWRFTAAALWQFQYKSIGPDGRSDSYQTKGVLPEFYVGFDYTKNGFQVGAGVDLLRLRPRTTMEVPYTKVVYDSLSGTETIEEGTTKRIVKEYAFSASPLVYINYKKDKFHLLWKCLMGQNTAHLNMMSGLGVTKINEDGSWDYSPLRNVTTFVNLTYGSAFKVNLFGGYFKNLGTSKEIVGDLWVNGASNIDYIWRVCPAVSYTVWKLTFGVEYELTTVGYGDGRDEFGKADAVRDISNNRICAMIKFAW